MQKSIDLVNQLSHAQLSSPFTHLGPISQGKKNKIQTWQPNAVSVAVHDHKTNKLIGNMDLMDQAGLFELNLGKELNTMYKFVVEFEQGKTEIVDPYQFKEQAFHAVHYLQTRPENVYNQLGAQKVTLESGVAAIRFAVFAPNASSCSLIGEFNDWDGRKMPMEKTDCGHFVLVVADLDVGTRYKFELKDAQGHNLPHKSDPVGFWHDQYPSFASRIYDHDSYQWQDDDWQNRQKTDPYQQPMSVYEVHLGSWRMKQEGDEFVPLSYAELTEQLIPYVVEMGYTHLELLPVSEHPFTGSWGYQPTGMFAPTTRFGDPDEFKSFVDACHKANIAVIMDWVPAHFPEDGHGLARFDGTHVYEYEDPRRGWHPDWNSCIYDFGNDTVRQFLVASALYWIDKFHIDGIRVDAVASMLYWDYSREEGEWIPNVDGGNHNYEAISLLKWMNEEVKSQFPNALTIAEESTSFAGVSKEVNTGGLGFHFKWNMGWMHDSLTYISKDPCYRRYHHNDITFAMVYNYDEHFVLPISHDEVVHGKGSLLRKMPGDEWQQAANHRCYAAFMYAHPGKKLNFMGNELGQSEEWNHNQSLSWHLTDYDKHSGIQSLYRDLNKVYKETPALYQLDHQQDGFEWLDHSDAEQSTLAFVRRDANGDEVIVISNFTPIPRENYRVGVNLTGEYQVFFNSDSQFYWGSNYGVGDKLVTDDKAWHYKNNSLLLNLPPLSTIYLKRVS